MFFLNEMMYVYYFVNFYYLKRKVLIKKGLDWQYCYMQIKNIYFDINEECYMLYVVICLLILIFVGYFKEWKFDMDFGKI